MFSIYIESTKVDRRTCLHLLSRYGLPVMSLKKDIKLKFKKGMTTQNYNFLFVL